MVTLKVAFREGSSKLGMVFLIQFRLKWDTEYQLKSVNITLFELKGQRHFTFSPRSSNLYSGV